MENRNRELVDDFFKNSGQLKTRMVKIISFQSPCVLLRTHILVYYEQINKVENVRVYVVRRSDAIDPVIHFIHDYFIGELAP